MIDPKDLFIAEHERLQSTYTNDHPGCSEQEACEETIDHAFFCMQERYAELTDLAFQRSKDYDQS